VGVSEEWESAGRELEAHLAQIEADLEHLRTVLRRMGIPVKRQRIRIQVDNAKAHHALEILRGHGGTMAPSTVGKLIGVSPTYAYDLLSSLVALGQVERVWRGRYRAVQY
jgi:predicted transcriptional regulator of viral defense system